MRVAMVCGQVRPDLDGVAAYTVRLAEELRGSGVDVHVVQGSTLADLPRIRRGCAGADVVHVQFAPSLYRFRRAIGLLPLLLGGTPLVTTLHEYGWWRWTRALPPVVGRDLERRRLLDRETGLLVPRSSRVVTTNPGHAVVVRRRFGWQVPVEIVPIGANVAVETRLTRAEARAEVRRELGLDPAARLVAFFGFVHPVKGVRYLADAVARLRETRQDLHLLVIGGFESLALPDAEARAFEGELRGQVEEVGMTEHTTITGYRDAAEVSRLLLAADIAALPFTAGVTAKSGSLLTVLAHGLPTVATATSEGADLVDGEQAILAHAVRDADALAGGLQRLLDDQDLASRVAASGERLAATRSWSAIAARHREIYSALAA